MSEGSGVGEGKCKVKVGDSDGMTAWPASGSCSDELVLVGEECVQIYSHSEQTFNGSKGQPPDT